MQRTRPPRRPLGRAALLAAALVGSLLSVAPAAYAAAEPVVIAGSLQDELGCEKDWEPACTATALTRVGESATYTRVFDLPAGAYEFKVAEGGSWSLNYGLGGAANGANIPLVLAGDASVRFTYDDETHVVSITTGTPAGGTSAADTALARWVLTPQGYRESTRGPPSSRPQPAAAVP